MTQQRPRPAPMPEKPTLDGLEAVWSGRWETEGTYRFDRSARARRSSRSTPRRRPSRAPCTSATSSPTPTPTPSPASSACAGSEVFYPMGWDDNGLPTERRVQNYFGVRCDPLPSPTTPPFEPPAKPDPKRPGRRSRGRNFIELCEQLTAEDEKAFEELWRRLGPVGRLVADLRHHRRRRPGAPRQRAFLRNLARGEAYAARGAHAVGRRPSAPPSPRPSWRTGSGPAPTTGWRFSRGGAAGHGAGDRRDRDDPARAAARLRRAGRPPRRRALPAAVRHHGQRRRCSASRCRCSPTTWPSPTRARASP